MTKLINSALLVAACVFAASAFADSVVDEVWKCKVNEGKEMDEVNAANSDWVKRINSLLEVGEIKSGTSVSIVGDQEYFYFVDTYPSMAAYAAAKEYLDSDEGEAAMKEISDRFDNLFDCSSNRLYKYTPN